MINATNNAGVVYGYRRCSHENSAYTGLGLDEQRDKIIEFANRLIEKEPGLVMGRIFEDQAVSASKYRFALRRGGRELSEILKPGDHVILAEVSRGFRELRDQLVTVDDWAKQGIIPHFLDAPWDIATAEGLAAFQMTGMFAEYHARKTSERNKAVAARLRASGRPTNGSAPYGFTITGPKGRRKFSPMNQQERIDQRRIPQVIVHLYDEEGLTFAQVSDEIERRLAKRECRQPIPAWSNRPWKRDRCRRAYRAEKAAQAEEAKLRSQIALNLDDQD
jgi:DNA invertase Pin-like site-specific DNA recombinase